MSQKKFGAVRTGRAWALVLALSFALPRAAWACECVPPPPPAQALSAADAVFEGRVRAVTTGTFETSQGGALPGREVRLLVLRAWKGATAGDEVTLRTGMSQADCGFAFAEGSSYLVYARRLPSGELSTNICSRTRASALATEDFAALGAPSSEGGPAPFEVATAPRPTHAAVPSTTRVGCAGCASTTGRSMSAVPLALVATLATLRVRRRR